MEFSYLALHSFEIFLKHVIGHAVGDYHKELFDLLENDRICVMSPRGHAKTEIFSVCYSIWKALNAEELEIVIVSSTDLSPASAAGNPFMTSKIKIPF